MNQRMVRWLIVGLLLAFNLLLLLYQLSQRRTDLSCSREQMEKVFSLYEQEKVTFSEEPSGDNQTWYELKLVTADVDRMAERFLSGESYDKSYIYGSKVQYNSGDIVLLTNRPQHTVTYTDESIGGWEQPRGLTEDEVTAMLQPLARRFAEKWLGDVYLSEWRQDAYGYRFIFRQYVGGQIYYFNSISLVVTMDGVKAAVLTYWEVSDQGERLMTLPMDEMLYAGLRRITQMGEAPVNIDRIVDGYIISSQTGTDGEETASAVPVQTMILSSGRSVTTRYSGKN